ncbi:MAG TPA: DUF4292 domain-containing protein [Chitinophagales bacterium]|nr:DUF4292 domain-containing protein [Chitinophagales bacterium]
MKTPKAVIIFFAASFLAIKSFAADSTAVVNYDTVLTRVTANELSYRTLAVRAKMAFDDGKAEQDFQASIRMEKDSLVWCSISGGPGIEVARLILTPDTFRIIYRLSKQYAERPFSFIRNWLLFPVNFKMLQQLITGARFDIAERASALGREDSLYVLYAENEKLREETWVDSTNYTPVKTVLKDKLLKQQMTLTFGGYNRDQSAMPFAQQREITVERDGVTLKLNIEYSRLRLNGEESFPFEMNGKYTRVE